MKMVLFWILIIYNLFLSLVMTNNTIMSAHVIISILPLIASLFWLVVMILDKDRGDRRSSLLTLFIYSSIVYLCHAFFFNHLYSLYAVVESLWVFTSLMVFPVFYIYIRTLTAEKELGWGWAWLSLPAALIAMVAGLLYILMTPEETEAFVRGVLYKQPGYETDSLLVQLQRMRTVVVQIVFLIQVLATLYFGLHLIKEYNRKLQEHYADTNGKSLKPIKVILILFVIVSLMSSVANLMGKSYFIENPHLLVIPSVIFSIILTVMGYFTHKQRYGIDELISEPDNQRQISVNENRDAPDIVAGFQHIEIPVNDSLSNQIKYLLNKAEIYKYKELRIHDLSLLLNTNRTYLSQVIKEDFGTNFSDLINSYRAKYAAKLLEADASKKSLSMDDIASLSGFSSKSSFFRVFKANMGVTPGRYKAKVD